MTAKLYKIGYRQPPQHSQFKKGESGNPNGRPKKSNLPEPQEERFNKIIQEECYRTVEIDEGGKKVAYPIVQIGIRKLLHELVKDGSLGTGRLIIEQLRLIESKNAKGHLDFMKELAFYQTRWREYIHRNRVPGCEEPDVPLPHPNDIHFDWFRGRYEIKGPLTDEQKKDWDKLSRMRVRDLVEIEEFEKTPPKHRDERLEEWVQYLRNSVAQITDLIGDYDYRKRRRPGDPVDDLYSENEDDN